MLWQRKCDIRKLNKKTMSALLFFLGVAVTFGGALTVIFANTGEQDTLGGGLVLGGFILGAIGGLLLVAGV